MLVADVLLDVSFSLAEHLAVESGCLMMPVKCLAEVQSPMTQCQHSLLVTKYRMRFVLGAQDNKQQNIFKCTQFKTCCCFSDLFHMCCERTTADVKWTKVFFNSISFFFNEDFFS